MDLDNDDGQSMNEMCHATKVTETSKRHQHEVILSPQLVIDDLRSRLSKRNALLDTIRKAYHRDVIAIKEHLIDLASRDILPDNHDVHSFLCTVPSIDVRPTLSLFAPQECDLELHPCHSCGGQLEIIHRESSRMVQYKRAIELLQKQDKEMRCQVVDARVDVKHAEALRDEAIEHANAVRDILEDQILALKYEVADRNALEEELRRTKEEKRRLEDQIEVHRPLLEERKQLLVDIQDEKRERENMTQKFHAQVNASEALQSQNNTLVQELNKENNESQRLRQQLASSEEQYQNLRHAYASLESDLAKSKEATSEAESCLQKAEEAIYELEFDLEQEKEQSQSTISDLESKCADISKTVTELNERVRLKSEEAAEYRRRIDTTLEGAKRRGSILSVPKSGNAAFEKTDELIRDLDKYRLKNATLSSLLLSCIRSTYENCLVQENMLHENGSELQKNKKMLNAAPPTNEFARMILDSLDNAKESDTIEWALSLKNEMDQRHVLGNLQNRLQMGQFSLTKCFEKIHKSAATDMRKCQEKHKKQIDEKVNRIWELEKLLTETIKVNRRYEEKMRIIRNKYENAEEALDQSRGVLRKLRKDCQHNRDISTKLFDDFSKLRPVTERLLQELANKRLEIISLNTVIGEKQDDIDGRDEAIEHLEKLLENITHRYAENERLRIKVTHERAVQAVIATKEICCVADFLPTPLRTVTTNDDDSKSKASCDALLPGRIIQIKDDENWPVMKYPSRVNVKPPSSLNFRRAIDRL